MHADFHVPVDDQMLLALVTSVGAGSKISRIYNLSLSQTSKTFSIMTSKLFQQIELKFVIGKIKLILSILSLKIFMQWLYKEVC